MKAQHCKGRSGNMDVYETCKCLRARAAVFMDADRGSSPFAKGIPHGARGYTTSEELYSHVDGRGR